MDKRKQLQYLWVLNRSYLRVRRIPIDLYLHIVDKYVHVEHTCYRVHHCRNNWGLQERVEKHRP